MEQMEAGQAAPRRSKNFRTLAAMCWEIIGDLPKDLFSWLFWSFDGLQNLPKWALSKNAIVALGYKRDSTNWFTEGTPQFDQWGYPDEGWKPNTSSYFMNSMVGVEVIGKKRTDEFEELEPEATLSASEKSRLTKRTACISYVQQKTGDGNNGERLRGRGLRAQEVVEKEICHFVDMLGVQRLWHDGLGFRHQDEYNTAAGLLPYASDESIVVIHVPHDRGHGGYHFIGKCDSPAERGLQYHIAMEAAEVPYWWRVITGERLKSRMYGEIPMAKWIKTQRLWPLAEVSVALSHGRVYMTPGSQASLARLLAVIDDAIDRLHTESLVMEGAEFGCFPAPDRESFRCACGMVHRHDPKSNGDEMNSLIYVKWQIRRWVAQILHTPGNLPEEVAREMFQQKMWEAPAYKEGADRIPVAAIAGYILAERGIGAGSMNLRLTQLLREADPFGACVRSMVGRQIPTLPLVGEEDKNLAILEQEIATWDNHPTSGHREVTEGRWQIPSPGKSYCGALTACSHKLIALDKLKHNDGFIENDVTRTSEEARHETLCLLDRDLEMQQRSMIPLIGTTLPWYVSTDSSTYIVPVLLLGGLIENTVVTVPSQGATTPCLQAVVQYGTRVNPRADINEAEALEVRLNADCVIHVKAQDKILAYLVLRTGKATHFAAFKTCERLGTFPVCNFPGKLSLENSMRMPTQTEMFSAANVPRDYSKEYMTMTKLQKAHYYAQPSRVAGNTWVLEAPSKYDNDVAGSAEWLLNRWNILWT